LKPFRHYHFATLISPPAAAHFAADGTAISPLLPLG